VNPVSFADLRSAKRSASRLQLLQGGKRQYAAAKTTRLTGDWYPITQSVNDIIGASSTVLRSRVRQLVRDFPYFARAVDILVNWTVGSGMNFQSRVLNPKWQPGGQGVPKFDRATCQRIEDALAWWMDEADVTGRMHFHDLERLAKREEVEAGEYLFVKRQIKDRKRFLPFALQACEADWLTDLGAKPEGKNPTDRGKEYDAATGRIVAYHLTDPAGWGKTIRVSAEHVVAGFDTQRSGQIHGVSPFVTAVLIAHDLNDYLDATIDTAKLAAKYLAMVETGDPAGFQAMRSVDGEGTDAGKKIESIENAIIEYLRPGEKITFAKNDNPGQTFEPFTRFVLRMAAIATGTSYSLLAGDYSTGAYTALRAERQDLLRMFEPHQNRHARGFFMPCVKEAIEQAVFAGKLDLPGYFREPRPFWRSVIIPPGGQPLDPLREAKANRDDIASGLQSPQRIAARRGEDIEEILDEIGEFQEMVAERGIVLESTSTALANNPAALGAEEGASSLAATIRRAIDDALDRRDLLMEDPTHA
jgi:lambda family phage portal protein